MTTSPTNPATNPTAGIITDHLYIETYDDFGYTTYHAYPAIAQNLPGTPLNVPHPGRTITSRYGEALAQGTTEETNNLEFSLYEKYLLPTHSPISPAAIPDPRKRALAQVVLTRATKAFDKALSTEMDVPRKQLWAPYSGNAVAWSTDEQDAVLPYWTEQVDAILHDEPSTYGRVFREALYVHGGKLHPLISTDPDVSGEVLREVFRGASYAHNIVLGELLPGHDVADGSVLSRVSIAEVVGEKNQGILRRVFSLMEELIPESDAFDDSLVFNPESEVFMPRSSSHCLRVMLLIQPEVSQFLSLRSLAG